MNTSRTRKLRSASSPEPTFTADDLLGSLAALLHESRGAEGMTTGEIEAARGWTHAKTLQALKRAQKAGRLVPGRAPRPAIDGTMRPVPVYRLVGA
jgi:predicted transcriptional regulator